MIRALVIGDAERALIDKAVRIARAHPVTLINVWEISEAVPQGRAVLTLEDRKPSFERPPVPGVDLPGGYQCAISFEEQPIGLCRHLSVSVDRKGFLPNMLAVGMIAEAFGFVKGMDRKIWVEEFAPGHHAVNVVEPVMPNGSETRQ